MKHLVNIVGFLCIWAFMQLVLVQYAEIEGLRPAIGGIEASGLNVSDWLRDFYTWASYCVGAGAFSFVVWYLFGHFTPPDYGGLASKRPWWILFLVVPIVMTVVSIFLLPTPQYGSWMADLFLTIDSVFTYWLSSALFSPTMVKTHVPFASEIRQWRDAILP